MAMNEFEVAAAASTIQMLLEHPVNGNYTYCGDHAFPTDARGIHGRYRNTSAGSTPEVTHIASGRRFRLPADWNGHAVHPDRLTELAPL